MEMPVSHAHMITLDSAALRDWPLPMPSGEGDKEQRGHVLIMGGSREMPGAIILAATAALRAGAGKLTIATGASVANLVALAMPEARVIGLRETDDGGFMREAIAELKPLADRVNAVLIGPGMQDETATAWASSSIPIWTGLPRPSVLKSRLSSPPTPARWRT